MTNPSGEPPSERPSWSWEPSPSIQRPPEDDAADAGLPESPDPGEPVSAPGPSPDSESEPAGDPVSTPPPPPAGPCVASTIAPPSPASSSSLSPERYPMRFDVAYPESLSRWKTALRIFLILPAWLFAWLVSSFINMALLIGWTTVFWRRKYPIWLFRGLSGAYEHSARVWSYGALLTDEFPSFDRDDSPVLLEYDEPPSGLLSRWRVLFWKYFLLIPTFVVLGFLSIAVFAVTVIAWFAIILTGNYPRGMFQFSVGVQRWYFRSMGYLASFNDRYPPYSLSEESGPASNGSTVASGVGGWVFGGGFVALVIVAVVVGNNPVTQQVDYARLTSGNGAVPVFIERSGLNDNGFIGISLDRAVDPGEGLVPILQPANGERVVVFEWSVLNASATRATVAISPVRLKYEYSEDGETKSRSVAAEIVTVANTTPPARIASGEAVNIHAVFVIPEDAEPLELRLRGGFVRTGGIKYEFR